MPLIYADAKHNDNFSVIEQLFVNLVDLFRISCLYTCKIRWSKRKWYKMVQNGG